MVYVGQDYNSHVPFDKFSTTDCYTHHQPPPPPGHDVTPKDKRHKQIEEGVWVKGGGVRG